MKGVAAHVVTGAGENPRHKAIAAYLDLAWPLHLPFTHFPAGENRGDHVERVDRRTGRTYRFSPAGKKLKDMGLRPGWWDFQGVLPNGQFWMAEVKDEGETLSDAQAQHLELCKPLGVAWAIWRSPEDAERTAIRWLAAFGLKPRATLIRSTP
jgi:hypothetical protein